MTKVLALDYGTKRIGIALSDETKTIAMPKPYIPTSEKGVLLDLIKNNEVEKVLLGLPTGLSGQDTDMTREVRGFGEWLKINVALPIEFIDERFSSKEVERITTDRELIDSIVAQQMLERYLEQLEQLG